MATAGLQKTPNEIIPASADFSSALVPGDSIISANMTVTVKNLLTDSTVSGAVVPASTTLTGDVISCQLQGGAAGDFWVTQFRTGLTTLGYQYDLDQNVEITNAPLVSNLLCDIDEVKLELGITDTSEDARLFILIAEASDYFTYRCQRNFSFQEYIETIRPADECYQKLLRLNQWPVYSVSGITLRQVNSVGTPIDIVKLPGMWGFRRDGYVWLLDDIWLPWPHENIITYRAGYPVIPKNIQRAVKGIAVWFYRLTGREGLSGEKIGSYSYTRARLTDFPTNMKFELADEWIEGVIGRYARRDISDLE